MRARVHERAGTVSMILMAACFLIAPGTHAADPQAPKKPLNGPLVVRACAFDISPPLRDIVSEETLAEGEGTEGAQPRGVLPCALMSAAREKEIQDTVVQTWPGKGTMPQPLASWEGISGIDDENILGFPIFPPDTNGDVGPNHYVQWVNLLLAVWDKSGHLLMGPVPGNAVWQGFGGAADQCNNGDPIALYDRLADRWFISQFAVCDNNYHGPFYQYVAVSATPDPTGPWYRYAFLWPEGKFNDYPKFGAWPDGYYMSSTQWGSIIDYIAHWAGEGVAVMDRAKMLAGDESATLQYFDLYGVDPTFGGMLPANVTGPTPPPSGTPCTFLAMNHPITESETNELDLWEFHVDWANPALTTFGQAGSRTQRLATAPYDSNMCTSRENCIRQPGTTTGLDAISDRVMYRLAYRNLGDHEALVVNHTVDVDGTNHGGVRWYELRGASGAWGIYQQGTFAPDADSRWMGSVAMDGSGDIALGYNVSSTTTYPSIRYAGRLAADPAGELSQGETELIAGGGSIKSATRWGDYSALSVDPTDDCTFWLTCEYVPADTDYGEWHTRIASFRFPSCGIAVSAQASPTSGSAPLAVTFTAEASGGTPPYTYAWDFGDGADGTGATVVFTYPTPGAFTIHAAAHDAAGGVATAALSVTVYPGPPVIVDVKKLSSPFRLKFFGENFHRSCVVNVSGTPVPQTTFKSGSQILAGSGAALKALVPKGRTVQLTVTNTDDGGVSQPVSFSW